MKISSVNSCVVMEPVSILMSAADRDKLDVNAHVKFIDLPETGRKRRSWLSQLEAKKDAVNAVPR